MQRDECGEARHKRVGLASFAKSSSLRAGKVPALRTASYTFVQCIRCV